MARNTHTTMEFFLGMTLNDLNEWVIAAMEMTEGGEMDG